MNARAWWHGPRLLSDAATGGRAQPAIRIFGRWARGPLLSLMRLWRRNIQLRVIASTLLMSLAVVLVLGFVVVGQVRNGLLEAKRQTAQSQADGGFAVAEELAANAGEGAAESGPGQGQTTDPGTWMTGVVQQLASGGQGVYSVVALSSELPGSFSGEGVASPRGSTRTRASSRAIRAASR